MEKNPSCEIKSGRRGLGMRLHKRHLLNFVLLQLHSQTYEFADEVYNDWCTTFRTYCVHSISPCLALKRGIIGLCSEKKFSVVPVLVEVPGC